MTAPTPRRRPLAVLLALTALLGVLAVTRPAGAGAARPAADDDRPGRVLIVSIPRLTWDDVVEEEPQALTSFLGESAVGDLSLRTLGPRTSLGEAYLTMGAGNRASAKDADAGRMVGASERFENGSALEAYERRTGRASEAPLLQLSIAAITATNDRYLYGAEPGLFGSVLAEEGWQPAVVGNAGIEAGRGAAIADPDAPTGEPVDGQEPQLPIADDPSPVLEETEPLSGGNRPAGLAVMNRHGEVLAGSVANDLLVKDPQSAFGVRLAEDKVLEELDEAFTDRSVVLVELSDLERADYYRRRAEGRQAAAIYDRSLAQTDALLGRILRRTGPDDLVVVVSPVAPRSGETLTPIAVRGPGFDSGVLRSGTTRRAGYVTIPDIPAMVLDQLGIEVPDAMSGAPMAVDDPGNTSADRYEDFLEANAQTRFRDRTAVTITVLFVVLQVVLYALAVAVLLRGQRRLRVATLALGLVTMSIPVVTFLLGLVRLDRAGFVAYLAAMFAGAAALAGLAVLVGRAVAPDRRVVLVPLVPVALTYLVLLVDVATGGRLQINTTFGYSPVVAGRFAGFGNPAYALFAMSAVLLSCGGWAFFGGERPGPHRRRLAVAVGALFALTVAVDGHPGLGADVGGILSIIPAAFVVLWLLLERRLRVRVLLASVAVTALLLGVFAFIDLQRPESSQTHLGRLVRSTFGDEGGSGLLTVITRKMNANLSLLFTSTFSWSIPIALVLLVLLVWRRPAVVERHLEDRPALRACLWGGITMCFLGMAVNDSGIAVPSVMFTLFLPYVVHQVVAPEGPGEVVPPPGAREPADPSTVEDAEPEPALR